MTVGIADMGVGIADMVATLLLLQYIAKDILTDMTPRVGIGHQHMASIVLEATPVATIASV